ncbi:MAG: hypothetical protein Q4P33_06345, partial [Flaviflexus sp.]|nr:hypothetical protein [Flaviflexus sp.]
MTLTATVSSLNKDVLMAKLIEKLEQQASAGALPEFARRKAIPLVKAAMKSDDGWDFPSVSAILNLSEPQYPAFCTAAKAAVAEIDPTATLVLPSTSSEAAPPAPAAPAPAASPGAAP